jgi:hypothetical protein
MAHEYMGVEERHSLFYNFDVAIARARNYSTSS